MSKKLIVLGNASLANYPQGGGHWSVWLQYLLGLKKLGHNVFLLELMKSSGNKKKDDELINLFFSRLKEHGLEGKGILLLFEKDIETQDLNQATPYGKKIGEVKEIIEGADILWNFCASIRRPLLEMFKHRVLIDLDPGHLQVSALSWDLDIQSHEEYLTIGLKINDADCEVPTLGVQWKTFTPFVYLPYWEFKSGGSINKSFTSITHWNWGELWMGEKVLSISKRDAYMRYIDLPKSTDVRFELATIIKSDDKSGDKDLLLSKGWNIVDAWEVAKSPTEYRQYVSNSYAEISCPKPIFRELKTGWISDRSVCYLACGRPVLAENTGFSDYLPTGKGLLVFSNLEEAVAGVKEIENNYAYHANAARELAENIFNSDQCLTKMLNL